MPVGKSIEIAKMCEEAGFNTLFVADESPSTPFRDPYVVMAGIAAATKKIKIGPGISNPYTRHPAMIANAIATLDEIAPGRIILGIGAGGSMPIRPIGLWPRIKPVAAVRECIDVCRKLLAGETVDYEGKVIKCDKAKVLGPPKEKVPIYLAARRRMMLRLIGEIGDGAIIDVTPWSLKHIEEGARRAGRSLTDIDIGHTMPIRIVRNEEEKKKARDDRRYSLPFRIADSPIEQVEIRGVTKEQQEKIIEAIKKGGVLAAKPLITDEVVDRYAAIGTADEVIEIVKKRMVEGANFYWISMPPGPDPEYAFKALGEEVLPALSAEI